MTKTTRKISPSGSTTPGNTQASRDPKTVARTRRPLPDTPGNVFGADPHKRTLTAMVLDCRGGVLGTEVFRVSGEGHRAMEAWAMAFGPARETQADPATPRVFKRAEGDAGPDANAECLGLWHKARRSLLKSRQHLLNEAESLLGELPEAIRAALPDTSDVRARLRALTARESRLLQQRS
ncbi:MAG: hypothetical protein ACRDYY_07490 [Acidimicrobiales bacterium]